MTHRPLVSIVIVSWNALPLLKQCLPSVIATSYPNLEIILADNASTDGTREWIEEMYGEQVQVVRHPENWGFARGNNAALPYADGKYVVLLNNDVEVPEDWLGPLIRTMEANPSVAAIQPKLLQYEDRTRFEYAGGAGGFLDSFGYPFTRGRIFSSLEQDKGQYDDRRHIFWASGAACVLRRSALDEVGYLDERFEMHMEEIDLCWRLARHGYDVMVEPASQVYHIGGGSLPQGDPDKMYYNYRNGLLMLYKNLTPSHWRRALFVRLVLDIGALLYMAATRQWSAVPAIIRGYRDAFRSRSAYRTSRPDDRNEAVLPPYRNSIVIDYFMRGRRAFSDLPSRRFRKRYRGTSTTTESR